MFPNMVGLQYLRKKKKKNKGAKGSWDQLSQKGGGIGIFGGVPYPSTNGGFGRPGRGEVEGFLEKSTER